MIMNTIGVIGGNGIHATSVFYEKLLFKARSVKNTIPELIIYSLPIREEIECEFVMGRKEKEDYYSKLFNSASRVLCDAGAEIVAMPCFSLTPILGMQCNAVGLQMLNPLYLLDDKLSNYKVNKLGILATSVGYEVVKNSINSTYNIIPPKPSIQDNINSLIHRILSGKCDISEAKKELVDICTEYALEVDIIIIGCSELSVLNQRSSKCIDVMDVLVDMTLDWWINNESKIAQREPLAGTARSRAVDA